MTVEPRNIRTAAEEELIRQFHEVAAALPGTGALATARSEAFRRFEALGLPNRRVEEWKYTDLRNLLRSVPPPAAPAGREEAIDAAARASVFDGLDRARMVFVDGAYVPELSDLSGLGEGVSVTPLSSSLAAADPVLERIGSALGGVSGAVGNPVAELNTAFMTDGATVHVAEGVRAGRPLEIVHAFSSSTASAAYLRHLVVLEAGACLELIETSVGPDGVGHLLNAAMELLVGEKATLRLARVEENGDASVFLTTIALRAGREASVETLGYSATARVGRQQYFAAFDGEHARGTLCGATLLDGERHMDSTLVVDHNAPHCESRELFKAIVDGRARSVFQGRINVRRAAQKTDAKLMSRALLLSAQAEATTKPELEIFADDVVCGHGATCGAIDEELLFYLMSRGITRAEAERILVVAFLSEAIEAFGNADISRALSERIDRWLAQRASESAPRVLAPRESAPREPAR